MSCGLGLRNTHTQSREAGKLWGVGGATFVCVFKQHQISVSYYASKNQKKRQTSQTLTKSICFLRWKNFGLLFGWLPRWFLGYHWRMMSTCQREHKIREHFLRAWTPETKYVSHCSDTMFPTTVIILSQQLSAGDLRHSHVYNRWTLASCDAQTKFWIFKLRFFQGLCIISKNITYLTIRSFFFLWDLAHEY